MHNRAFFRRVTASLLGVALVVIGAGNPAGAQSTGAESRSASVSQVQARKTYPTRWKCNDNDVCVRLTGRAPGKFTASWRGVVENRTSRWIRGAHCKSKQTRTQRYETSASIGAELKAGLFGSLNATISGSASREMTTEIEFSVPFDVPPRTNTACTQGIRVFRWRAQLFDRVRQSTQTFTVRAPKRVAWVIRDIK